MFCCLPVLNYLKRNYISLLSETLILKSTHIIVEDISKNNKNVNSINHKIL